LLLARSGLNEEALSFLQTAGQNTPRSFPLLYALGVVTAALKQYDKADEHLIAALAIKPDDVATLRALARVARANGNLEKALAHLVAARRVAPDSAAVLYDFGVTALRMDLVLDALPVFERLHREYPRTCLSLRTRGGALDQGQRYRHNAFDERVRCATTARPFRLLFIGRGIASPGSSSRSASGAAT
jgi:tetratricopeptide (TPR) repeat protein